jgi:hypothetical protein
MVCTPHYRIVLYSDHMPPCLSIPQGHLLGINDGLWEARGCMYGCRPNHPEDTVYYLCKNARREFQATPTCSGNLILETAAGGGSACAHW